MVKSLHLSKILINFMCIMVIFGPYTGKGYPMSGNNKKDNNKQDFSWIVGVFDSSVSADNFKCVGNLINKQYVLATPYCAASVKMENIVIVVGTNDIFNKVPASRKFSVISVRTLMPFDKDDYGLGFITNNIALIKLDKEVNFSNMKVSSILLPSQDSPSIDGKTVTVVGWKASYFNFENNLPQNSLLQTTLKAYETNTNCEEPYYGFNETVSYCVDDKSSSICCYYSDGASSVFKINGNWYLYGFFSYCVADADTCPQVEKSYFTKISYYLNWINNTMKTM